MEMTTPIQLLTSGLSSIKDCTFWEDRRGKNCKIAEPEFKSPCSILTDISVHQMSQLQPRRSLKPVVNPKRWNRKPITVSDAIEGELIEMHEQALQERDQLLIEKKEMDRKLHDLETKSMSDQHKVEELKRQLRESEESNTQLRSQVAELKKEQASTSLADKTSDAHHAYSDEEESYNFIVDAYDRRSSQDISISSQNEKEYEMAAQAAVALIAKESAMHRRDVYHLRLLAQNQETLIHKLEKKLINTLEATNKRARASNLMLLEGMERSLLQDSMQAKYEQQQLEISKNEKLQENPDTLNIYTSVSPSTTNSYTPYRKDLNSTASHRTSISSAMLQRKRPSIPPVTPPPREPLPPLPFRESYTSSSARTSSSSVQSFSVSSPTTYSSSDWEKSGSSGHPYPADLDKITIQGEGDDFSKAARGRSGFWKGLRSKMVHKN
jgi:regulator of replication initiation timing